MLFNKKKTQNCVIIGSGPAGYSAAIYTARADMNPLLFTGFQPGGQLTTTTDVDNYLGFPEGINGIDFMKNCRMQAERFNTKIINESVNRVILSNKKGGIHRIFFDQKKCIESRGLIIATGSRPKFLGINKEKKFLGLGVSFCATCDGFFHKEKDVAVIGGGDSALEEASYLAKICRKVYLIVRKDYFKASKILQCRILKKKNINILFYSNVTEIIGGNFLEGIKIFNKKNKKNRTILISGLFIAIGHTPNTEIFKNELDLNEKGYIIVEKGKTITSKPGVFAAGDVQDPDYRQAITSAGTGCMAALDLEKYYLLQT
ncbi:thioredoxin-disulfide reductase [Blattabacterium sp. (Blaberus giganteus)]|uniref:thioredoxin-disulfide reductase n=1 Tax=Blattabacterium sp. (Blaberus giganteus) TaxID=1186051 RepID=UPI00025F7056|nr:thioredoxin-disulfide reductase [Blattabacterium sp. (Blaberus giganteus)]AFJ91006.1 thioredoxin-disulfide reductase [Blattabacterium sp. (Blaberus giganteus)]